MPTALWKFLVGENNLWQLEQKQRFLPESLEVKIKLQVEPTFLWDIGILNLENKFSNDHETYVKVGGGILRFLKAWAS